MEPFPFTKEEWNSVREAVLPVHNATLADDPIVRASHLIGLIEVLAGLRDVYGNHPVLLETEADFTEDEHDSITLYRQATDIASQHSLPTFSIRLSLAQVLFDIGDPSAANQELLACEAELVACDEWEKTEWANLMREVNHN
ncbi:hypothetical protein BH11PLA2_BH11PLA2_01380 [soil metagenome]